MCDLERYYAISSSCDRPSKAPLPALVCFFFLLGLPRREIAPAKCDSSALVPIDTEKSVIQYIAVWKPLMWRYRVLHRMLVEHDIPIHNGPVTDRTHETASGLPVCQGSSREMTITKLDPARRQKISSMARCRDGSPIPFGVHAQPT